MELHKHNCREALARINGRTLKDALDKTKAKSRFGKIHPKRWVDFDSPVKVFNEPIKTANNLLMVGKDIHL